MAAGFSPVTLPTSEVINNYKDLSLKLYVILESLGVSTDVRKTRTEIAAIIEMLHFIAGPSVQQEFFVFGSSYEGSYTVDMETDVDVIVICSIPVVCTTEDMSESQYPHGLLLLPDQKFPGYAKLQCLSEKELFENDQNVVKTILSSHAQLDILPDSQSRLCLTSSYQMETFGALPIGVTLQGPALQIKSNTDRMSADYVFAFQCDKWPSLAIEWLTRTRNHGWPSNDLIQKIITYGFIVVKACHPQSDEKYLQWRVSFSRQERDLVANFSMVQMKCYVLLKLIKKDIINKAIGEETLTSYHCKTCMFYMLENTTNSIWIPENLASCLLMCLRQIRKWAKNDNCPNYFIPGENMFERILNQDLKLKLFEVLDMVINSDLERWIMTIRTDQIGTLLNLSGIHHLLYPANTKLCVTIAVLSLTSHLASVRNLILMEHYNNNLAIFNKNIRIFMNNMWRTIFFPDRMKAEIIGKYLITPFLLLTILTNTAIQQVSDEKTLRTSLESDQWEKLENTGFSKLKQACISLALKDNMTSLQRLLKVEQSNKKSLCTCNRFNAMVPNAVNISTFITKDAVTDLMRHTLLPCVSFLPCEQLITPCAIRYEMIRCFAVPIADQDMTYYYWLNWGMVDGMFLTLFLLYLNYTDCGQTSSARECVEKMILLINKGTVSHRETCLNLLGWVHRERGEVNRAAQCFTKSLKEQPTYNVAYWHLCFLMRQSLIPAQTGPEKMGPVNRGAFNFSIFKVLLKALHCEVEFVVKSLLKALDPRS